MSPVKVALLGCGLYQNAHAIRLKNRDDVCVVAVCDIDLARAQELIDRSLVGQNPPPEVFSDPGRMYDLVHPDASFIATPHTLHYDHAVQALDAGCHVYLEKPMVTRAQDAYELSDKVSKTGKILVVGYNTPCTPEFEYLRSQMKNEVYGRLELVVGHMSQDWLVPMRGTWRQDPKLSGGGQAYDSGAHILNSLVWVVQSPIARVFAFLDHCGSSVDVNSSINIRFENGTLAAIGVSGNCPQTGAHMSFMFEHGKIEIDPWFGGWINVHDRHGRVKYPQVTGKMQYPDDNFIDAILGRDDPRTSPSDGVIQSELMDAIYESARTGRPAQPNMRP